MLRRRRPLATAAVIGGAAYVGSKKGAQAGQAQAEPEYEEAPPAAAAAPAPSGMSNEAMAQLENLAKLKEQGILTDAEFEIQKQKILQGM